MATQEATNWPAGATAARAARLGLSPPADFAEIIRLYLDEHGAGPTASTRG